MRLDIATLCRRIFAVWICLVLSAGAAQAYQVRIMPLGDSITSGQDGFVTYRYWLWWELNWANFSVDFVGSQVGVPNGKPGNPAFDQNHESYLAIRTDVIANNVTNWARASQPHVVLLMAGLQDIQEGQAPFFTIYHLARTINGLRSVNPYVTIMLAKLPPIRNFESRVNYVNGGIAWLGAALDLPWSRVVVVDQYTGYTVASDTRPDGIHPNATGEIKVATRWFYSLIGVLRLYGQYRF